MAYEIKHLKLNAFTTDKEIKLPRFQRKRTWKPGQNFLLALSLFKGYPIGFTILNHEKEGNSKSTKWLLDGRQRRTALELIYNDPTKIYEWSRKFVKFKNLDQPEIVKALFNDKVREYIDQDSTDVDFNEIEGNELEDSDDSVTVIDFEEDDYEPEQLDLLLDLILICHNIKSNTNHVQRLFDFSKHFSNDLPFKSNVSKVDTVKLKKWIDRYLSDSENWENVETFVEYLVEESRMIPKTDHSKTDFKKEVNSNKDEIFKLIRIYNKINNLFANSEIGLIEISDIKPNDAQKIFNIINTEGTKLTAAEILSAKPSWNRVVKNPTQSIIDIQRRLYEELNIEHVEDVVRWDVAATFLNRIVDNGLVFDKLDSSEKFEKSVTMSFKILAGFFEFGITKDHINNLSENAILKDLSKLEEFIVDLNQMLRLLNNEKFFKYVMSWKKSLMTLTSDAIAYNFILLLHKLYVELGKPIGSNVNTRKFEKAAISLFDRSIYEYSIRLWAGSSDSRVAKNLKNYNSSSSFESVSESDWFSLINGVIDEGQIGKTIIDQTKVTPVLYHYYYLSRLSGPDMIDGNIEVDHIIPKDRLEGSSDFKSPIIVHNLTNLELLPKGENISKNKKTLNMIDDPWLIEQIEKYSGITKVDFVKYSNVESVEDLKSFRKPQFINAFGKLRNNLLNN